MWLILLLLAAMIASVASILIGVLFLKVSYFTLIWPRFLLKWSIWLGLGGLERFWLQAFFRFVSFFFLGCCVHHDIRRNTTFLSFTSFTEGGLLTS